MQAIRKEQETPVQGETSSNAPLSEIPEKLAWFAVLVAGLGYFVDAFDLWLFSNFRVASLAALGLPPEQITHVGAHLMNWQQMGLICGGFFWGILGDKRGRSSVMFGSILLYSVANLLNAFVTTVEQYSILRFIAGLGLAGEIGAGITLIAELLPKTKRGIGTTIVTTLGVSGAIFAAMAGKYLDWRTAYVVGGVMGLALLFLRFMVHESGVFHKMKHSDEGIVRGSVFLLFRTRERVLRFLACILVGLPLYLCFAIFASFAPEIAHGLGIAEKLTVADVLLSASIGITGGDLVAGLLSQKLKSRKKPILLMLLVAGTLSVLLARGYATSAFHYSLLVGGIGVCTGYWACLITAAAENFGTNLRATVTTTVPNLIRGSAILLISSFVWLKEHFDMMTSLTVLTAASFALAFLSLALLKETFHQDLDFYER